MTKAEQRRQAIVDELELVLAAQFHRERAEAAEYFGITEVEYQRIFGGPSQSEWIGKKIREHEFANFELPAGTFREPEEFRATYQQEYVRALLKTSPQVFDELKELVPLYVSLFGVPLSDDEILQTQNKIEGFGRLGTVYKDPLARFPFTASSCDILPDYTWRRFKPAFQFARLVRQVETGGTSDISPVPEDLEIWLQEGLKQSAYHLDTAVTATRDLREAIVERFAAAEADHVVDSFVNLQCSIYAWMERHDFETDFMLNNAYLYLGQACQDHAYQEWSPTIFLRRVTRRLQGTPFTFEMEGWWAREESARDYQERVAAEVAAQLYLYLRGICFQFGLNDLVKITRPKDPDLEHVYWLVAWNEGATKSEIADEFGRSSETIDSALEVLKQYGLPVRVGKPGRPRRNLARLERVEEIHRIFVESRRKTGDNLSEKV